MLAAWGSVVTRGGTPDVLERLYLTVTQDGPFNWRAIAVSLAAIVLAIVSRQLVRRYRLPQLDTLAVFVLLTVVVWLLGWPPRPLRRSPSTSSSPF